MFVGSLIFRKYAHCFFISIDVVVVVVDVIFDVSLALDGTLCNDLVHWMSIGLRMWSNVKCDWIEVTKSSKLIRINCRNVFSFSVGGVVEQWNSFAICLVCFGLNSNSTFLYSLRDFAGRWKKNTWRRASCGKTKDDSKWTQEVGWIVSSGDWSFRILHNAGFGQTAGSIHTIRRCR